jgi:hypothetical protein
LVTTTDQSVLRHRRFVGVGITTFAGIAVHCGIHHAIDQTGVALVARSAGRRRFSIRRQPLWSSSSGHGVLQTRHRNARQEKELHLSEKQTPALSARAHSDPTLDRNQQRAM